MKPRTTINPRATRRILDEAASRRLTATLNCRYDHEWVTYPTRFLAVDPEDEHLWVSHPSGSGKRVEGIEPGVIIGIAFRRGPKKYLFNTRVLQIAAYPPEVRADPAIKLKRPNEVLELQRRFFNRIDVPEEITIPVDIWPASVDTPEPGTQLLAVGVMRDLSAGGVCVDVEPEHRERLQNNRSVFCAFAARPGTRPLRISSHICHQTNTSNGGIRLGLQFVNPSPTDNGHKPLADVIQLATTLYRMKHKKEPETTFSPWGK